MIKKITSILIIVLCFSVNLSAQETGTIGSAELDANYCLVLDEGESVVEFYSADISAFEFVSEIEAKKQFGMRSNNLITYTVDFENSLVVAKLHVDRLSSPKTIEWWNTYLLSLCE